MHLAEHVIAAQVPSMSVLMYLNVDIVDSPVVSKLYPINFMPKNRIFLFGIYMMKLFYNYIFNFILWVCQHISLAHFYGMVLGM